MIARTATPNQVLFIVCAGIVLANLDLFIVNVALPASSFSTGSAVINMIRQIGSAVGVAILVAIVGAHASPHEHMTALRLAWWTMAAVTVFGLTPLLLKRR